MRVRHLLPLLVMAAALVVYRNSLNGPFIWDDLSAIPAKELSRSLLNLAERGGSSSYLHGSSGDTDSGDGGQGSRERAELSVALDAAEALRDAEQPAPDPASSHVGVAPALDVPHDVAQGADQIVEVGWA
jgi:hypothetical protein